MTAQVVKNLKKQAVGLFHQLFGCKIKILLNQALAGGTDGTDGTKKPALSCRKQKEIPGMAGTYKRKRELGGKIKIKAHRIPACA